MGGLGTIGWGLSAVPGAPDFVGPVTPEQQAAYNANQAAIISNLESGIAYRDDLIAQAPADIGTQIGKLFGGSNMTLWLVVGVAVFAMLSGGRRR